ncbi:MAG: fumarate hydratase [Actinomycetota bacterium]
MRKISADEIKDKVAMLCKKANYKLPDDVKSSIQEAYKKEKSSLGKEVLSQIIKNYEIAENLNVPICQDTGIAVFFIKIGEDVKIVDGDIYDAITEGVRKGYLEGYLRVSMVKDPLYERENTLDNTPAIIHLEIVKGENLEITLMPKGAGSENMSKMTILTPSASEEDIENFVVKTVKEGGANACPPVIVGVGIGGNLESCTLLSKKALLRDVGKQNPDLKYAQLERRILKKINKLGIGPSGFGGIYTALAVHIETAPCHISNLPICVNLNCHAARKASLII